MNKIVVGTLLLMLLSIITVSPKAIAIQLTNDIHYKLTQGLKNNITNNLDKSAIQKILVDEANRQGIEPTLALAIAEVESNFDPLALSKAGAKGVMQIMPATAETVFRISSEELFDAHININLGVSFIKKLLNRYNQRIDIALSHYNGGSAVQDQFGRLSVIPATRTYVNKVLSVQDKFTALAYKLSTNYSSQAFVSENHYTKQRLNQETHTHNKPINYQTMLPTQQNVLKPEKLYSAEIFDNSLFKKMEKLRTLRLHNIMRNTQSKPANENKTIYRDARFTKPHYVNFTKEAEQSLSTKRKKVLGWESIFR